MAGVKFWKTPSRKIFAVNKRELRGQTMFVQSTMMNSQDSTGIITQSSPELQEVLEEVKGMKKALKACNLLFGLIAEQSQQPSRQGRRMHSDAKYVKPHPACRPSFLLDVVPTSLAVNPVSTRWFAGANGLSKSCPICRQERGYAQTARLHGLDEFIEEVRKLVSAVPEQMPEQAAGSTSQY